MPLMRNFQIRVEAVLTLGGFSYPQSTELIYLRRMMTSRKP